MLSLIKSDLMYLFVIDGFMVLNGSFLGLILLSPSNYPIYGILFLLFTILHAWQTNNRLFVNKRFKSSTLTNYIQYVLIFGFLSSFVTVYFGLISSYFLPIFLINIFMLTISTIAVYILYRAVLNILLSNKQ